MDVVLSLSNNSTLHQSIASIFPSILGICLYYMDKMRLTSYLLASVDSNHSLLAYPKDSFGGHHGYGAREDTYHMPTAPSINI